MTCPPNNRGNQVWPFEPCLPLECKRMCNGRAGHPFRRYLLYVAGMELVGEAFPFALPAMGRPSGVMLRGSIAIRLLVFAFALLMLAVSPGTGQATVRVGVADAPRDVLGVTDGELTGALAPAYGCVFRRAALEIQFVPVSLQRGLYYLGHGELDALMPLAVTADRDSMADFAGELFPAHYVFVTTKPGTALTEGSGLRFGTLRGFVGRVFVPESAAVLEEVTTWAQLPQMLRRDRIDAAVMPSILAKTLLEHREGEFFMQPAGSLPISMYLSRHEGSVDKTRRIREAVSDCRRDTASAD